MSGLGLEEAWLEKLRRPCLKNLQVVKGVLQEGRDVHQRDLRRALFLLLRDERLAFELHPFQTLFTKESAAKLERSLCEASSTVAALRLQPSLDTKIAMSKMLLVRLRYTMSKFNVEAPSVRFDAWEWLELLDQYVAQLEAKLKASLRSSCGDVRRQEAVVDDECLLLATLSSFALRAVKTNFKFTYLEIPWEEMEFLLVSFIESHTVYESWAFVVATVSTVLRHLEDFRRHLATLKARQFVPPADKFPKKSVFLARLKASDSEQDKRKAAIFWDCAALRDYQSLKTISEALAVAIQALSMGAAEYRERGCLAFHRALFVVGERMKNTWDSPNLSERYGNLIAIAASENLAATMTSIRNGLAHPAAAGAAESTAAAKLAVKEARIRMVADLQSIAATVKALLYDAEWVLLQGYWKYGAPHCDLNRALATLLEYVSETNPIDAELCRLLECISRSNPRINKQVFETLKSTILLSEDQARSDPAGRPGIPGWAPAAGGPPRAEGLRGKGPRDRRRARKWAHGTSFPGRPYPCQTGSAKAANHWEGSTLRLRFLHGVGGTALLSNLLKTCSGSLRGLEDMRKLISSVPSSKDVVKFVRLWRLSRRGGEIASFNSSLSAGSEGTEPSSDDLALALRVIQSLGGAQHEGASPLTRYSLEGAVRILASKWHVHRGRVQPLSVPFAPCLFGRHLRNFLNHGDKFLEVCFEPTSEIMDLCSMLSDAHQRPVADMERGAQPRPVPLSEAKAEHARLLQLVRLKCAMFRCAQAGDVDGIRRAAEGGADLSSRDTKGQSLLHVAARAGQVDVVKWLLALGVQAISPSTVDALDRTALHEAGSADVAEVLLQAGLSVEARDCSLQTPLSRAVCAGRVEVVRLLLGQPWRANHSVLDGSCCKPTHWAAWLGHVDLLQVLLQAGATCEAVDKDAVTPLRLAARGGHAAAVRFLLGPRARPRPTDKECNGCIREAAISGRAEAFHVLLEELRRRTPARGWAAVARGFLPEVIEGGDKDVIDVFLRECDVDVGPNMLEQAALVGAEASVSALLARGMDPAVPSTLFGSSALHCAIKGGSVEVVRAILERIPKGHSLRTGRGERISPLLTALMLHRFELVPLLIRAGANVDAGCHLPKLPKNLPKTLLPKCEIHLPSPLSAAAVSGRAEAVRLLLERGARWRPGLCEWTPLHAAACCGHSGVVKVLVPVETPPDASSQYLALVQCADEFGWTPLLCALWSGSEEVVSHLLQREEQLLSCVQGLRGQRGEGRPASPQRCNVIHRDARGRSVLDLCVTLDCAPDLVEAVLHSMEGLREVAGLSTAELLALVKDVQSKIQEGRYDGGDTWQLLLNEWISRFEQQSEVVVAGSSESRDCAPSKASKRNKRKKRAKGKKQKSSENAAAPHGQENGQMSDCEDWLVVDKLADASMFDHSNSKKKTITKVLKTEVRRLSSLWCPRDPVWSMELLQAAAPRLEALHVRVVQAEHLAFIHTMPRLRRLYVASDPDLYTNPIQLPPLPAGSTAGLHWVRAYLPKVTFASLVRGHAHSLREVVVCAGTRGPRGYEDHYPYACTDLSPVFQGCALPALRRVVLWRSASFVHGTADCRGQVAAISKVLGSSVRIVCSGCEEVREDEVHEL